MNTEEILEILHRENLSLADIRSRTMAFIIDDLIVNIIICVAYFDLLLQATYSLKAGDPTQLLNFSNAIFLPMLILTIIYHGFFTWFYGATIGKIIMKIKIVYVGDFEKPSFFRALVRSCIRPLSAFCFYLGFVWAFFNPKRTTWHDEVAKTLVINA